VDLNGDGTLDMVFNNEGQESVVLLGSAPKDARRVPVLLTLAYTRGIVGSRVEVRDKEGKVHGACEISGGDGRGGQPPPQARFTLAPGAYRVAVRLSSGRTHTTDLTVADTPQRARLTDPAPASTAKSE
jgi:hypothetical protein